MSELELQQNYEETNGEEFYKPFFLLLNGRTTQRWNGNYMYSYAAQQKKAISYLSEHEVRCSKIVSYIEKKSGNENNKNFFNAIKLSILLHDISESSSNIGDITVGDIKILKESESEDVSKLIDELKKIQDTIGNIVFLEALNKAIINSKNEYSKIEVLKNFAVAFILCEIPLIKLLEKIETKSNFFLFYDQSKYIQGIMKEAVESNNTNSHFFYFLRYFEDVCNKAILCDFDENIYNSYKNFFGFNIDLNTMLEESIKREIQKITIATVAELYNLFIKVYNDTNTSIEETNNNSVLCMIHKQFNGQMTIDNQNIDDLKKLSSIMPNIITSLMNNNINSNINTDNLEQEFLFSMDRIKSKYQRVEQIDYNRKLINQLKKIFKNHRQGLNYDSFFDDIETKYQTFRSLNLTSINLFRELKQILKDDLLKIGNIEDSNSNENVSEYKQIKALMKQYDNVKRKEIIETFVNKKSEEINQKQKDLLLTINDNIVSSTINDAMKQFAEQSIVAANKSNE